MSNVCEYDVERVGRATMEPGLRKGAERQQRWRIEPIGAERRCCRCAHLIGRRSIERANLLQLADEFGVLNQAGTGRWSETYPAGGPHRGAVAALTIRLYEQRPAGYDIRILLGHGRERRSNPCLDVGFHCVPPTHVSNGQLLLSRGGGCERADGRGLCHAVGLHEDTQSARDISDVPFEILNLVEDRRPVQGPLLCWIARSEGRV